MCVLYVADVHVAVSMTIALFVACVLRGHSGSLHTHTNQWCVL